MSSIGLSWIQTEVHAGLDLARVSLERFATGERAGEGLDTAALELRRIRGALEILGYSSVAMLAEELELVAVGMVADPDNTSDALCASLMTGLLQAGDYVDYLSEGNRHASTALVPVVNELRAARGAPLLSAAAVFRPAMNVPLPRPEAAADLVRDKVRQLLTKAQPHFAKGLAAWDRGDPVTAGTALVRVLEAITRHRAPTGIWAPCWVLGALLAAHAAGHVDQPQTLRRLAGQAARLFQLVIDGRGSADIRRFAIGLLQMLLFHASRAGAGHHGLDRVRAAYGLDRLARDQARAEAVIRGFGPRTVRAVAEAVSDELDRVEAQLDQRARGTPSPGVGTDLARLADSFGLLDMATERRALARAAEMFSASDRDDGPRQMAATADALLAARASLGRLVEGETDDERTDARPGGGLTRLDGNAHHALSAAVINEVEGDLAEVEAWLGTCLEGDASSGSQAPSLVPARGALEFIGELDAAGALTRWERAALRTLAGEARAAAPLLERLATAIVSVEYHLESVAGRQPALGGLLEQAGAHLDAVEAVLAEAPERWPTLPIDAEVPPDAAVQTQLHEEASLADFQVQWQFLEPTLHEQVALWCARPQDIAANVVARRLLHDIKANAQLHGARQLGEVAGSAERLLGLCAAGDAVADPEVFELVERAVGALPGLMDSLIKAEAPPRGVVDLLADLQRRVALRRRPGGGASLRVRIDVGRSIGDRSKVIRTLVGDAQVHLEAVRELFDSGARGGRVAAVILGHIRAVLVAAREAGLTELAEMCTTVVSALSSGSSTSSTSRVSRFELAREIVESIAATIESIVAAECGVDGHGVASDPEPVPGRSGDADREDLIETFVDEAVEILDACDEAMNRWRSDPRALGHVREIQRELHTLKGGAHVGGLPAIGDLAHSLESVLMLIAGCQIEPSPPLLDLVEDCLERLAEMTEVVRSDQVPEPADDVVKRMDALVFSEVRPLDDADGVVHPSASADAPGDQALAGLSGPPRGERISVARASLDEVSDRVTNAGVVGGDLLRYLAELESELSLVAGQDAATGERLREHLSRCRRAVVTQVEQHASVHETMIGLRRTEFAVYVPRLRRVVERLARSLGKEVEFTVRGADIVLERDLLDPLIPSIAHMLRNAVVHGIEKPSIRRDAGKRVRGRVDVVLERDGSRLGIVVRDDGSGLDPARIARNAEQRGLREAGAPPPDDRELRQLILTPGFSTTLNLSHHSGRGLGLHVAAADIRGLGGNLEMESQPGFGVTFSASIPLFAHVPSFVLLGVGPETVAVEQHRVEVLMRARVASRHGDRRALAHIDHDGNRYRLVSLHHLLRQDPARRDDEHVQHGFLGEWVIVGNGTDRIALAADCLLGRATGAVLAGPTVHPGPAIGTLELVDRRRVPILDVDEAIRIGLRDNVVPVAAPAPPEPVPLGHGRLPSATDTAPHAVRPVILVVDDSVTVRKATRNALARGGMDTITAKDGLEALALLENQRPDAVLLDVEMPRLDGFAVARAIRAELTHEELPIIMVTSRIGEKHAARAREVGVRRYIGKPFQADDLLAQVTEVLAERYPPSDAVETGA